MGPQNGRGVCGHWSFDRSCAREVMGTSGVEGSVSSLHSGAGRTEPQTEGQSRPSGRKTRLRSRGSEDFTVSAATTTPLEGNAEIFTAANSGFSDTKLTAQAPAA